MLKFEINNQNQVVLIYCPDFEWDSVIEYINTNYDFNIKKYSFNHEDIIEIDNEYCEIVLLFAVKDGEYYKIDKHILSTKFDVYIDKVSTLNKNKLIVGKSYNSRGGSNVFEKIEKARKVDSPLYIGGEKGNISADEFNLICDNFPNRYEVDLYYNSRVDLFLSRYFDDTINYNEKFQKYLLKKDQENDLKNKSDFNAIKQYDISKYEVILEWFQNNIDKAYSESEWKDKITEILMLLFPNYIGYEREVYIKLNSNDRKKKNEYLDYMLIKSNGSIDLIEVKKPDGYSVISASTDHSNYFSTSSLTKTIMQIEKYIYNIQRNAEQNEANFNEKYMEKYENGFKFRIINPRGIIIYGRTKGLNKQQLNDLEVIRRMYSNIIEIYTYDDLLKMLKMQISLLKK